MLFEATSLLIAAGENQYYLPMHHPLAQPVDILNQAQECGPCGLESLVALVGLLGWQDPQPLFFLVSHSTSFP